MNVPTSTLMTSLQQRDRAPSLGSVIEDLIETRHPATVGQLARMLREMGPLDEEAYVAQIRSMKQRGSFTLSPPSYEIYSVLDYLLTPTVSGWFWATFFLTLLAVAVVYFTPGSIPLGIIRWVFGLVLIVSPGYATMKLLFPYSQMPQHQLLALAVALSLAITPIIGFALNFTPWGIRFIPIVVSLGAFTILTVTIAASRSYFATVQRQE